MNAPKSQKPKVIGVDHGKDDHSVEVVGRVLPDGSLEVLSLKRLNPAREQEANK